MFFLCLLAQDKLAEGPQEWQCACFSGQGLFCLMLNVVKHLSNFLSVNVMKAQKDQKNARGGLFICLAN